MFTRLAVPEKAIELETVATADQKPFTAFGRAMAGQKGGQDASD